MDKEKYPSVFIYGPTAVGKTALAIEVAQKTGGVIISADSMQLYKDLWLLSARPGRDELAQAEHWGFGLVDAKVRWSAKAWLDQAQRFVERARYQKRLPIFVGGTGLYHKILTEGLSNIPDPPDSIVEDCKKLSTEEIACQLEKWDPDSAHLQDRQRMIRALSVARMGEKPLSYWVQQPRVGAFSDVHSFVLSPDREQLHKRINQRFDVMIEQGALDEVKALGKRNLAEDLPCMRAIGVPELLAWIRGELAYDDAIEKAKAASRQYAKRQLTWARNQLDFATQLPANVFNRSEITTNSLEIFGKLDLL